MHNLLMSLALTPDTEQRLQRELASGPIHEPDALVNHLLDLLEVERSGAAGNNMVMNDWLTRNRDAVRVAIAEGRAAKERGESYSAEEVKAYFERRRAERASQAA